MVPPFGCYAKRGRHDTQVELLVGEHDTVILYRDLYPERQGRSGLWKYGGLFILIV
ncbi:hypothetical protein DSECCO2_365450 [anaerobic digester metagenome]